MKSIIANELGVNQLVREDGSLYMRAGERVLAHAHNFGHPMVVYVGAMLCKSLDVQTFDGYGRPLQYRIIETVTVRATDRENWFYVPAGVWHELTAIEDGTRYGCWYPLRGPTALTLHAPGAMEPEPVIRVDEHGRRWVMLDESIAAAASRSVPWPEALV